jgi:hypothetical protein
MHYIFVVHKSERLGSSINTLHVVIVIKVVVLFLLIEHDYARISLIFSICADQFHHLHQSTVVESPKMAIVPPSASSNPSTYISASTTHGSAVMGHTARSLESRKMALICSSIGAKSRHQYAHFHNQCEGATEQGSCTSFGTQSRHLHSPFHIYSKRRTLSPCLIILLILRVKCASKIRVLASFLIFKFSTVFGFHINQNGVPWTAKQKIAMESSSQAITKSFNSMANQCCFAKSMHLRRRN